MNGTKSPAERESDKERRALRIEFAKAAIPGAMEMVTGIYDWNTPTKLRAISVMSFSVADAMLAMLAELDRREKEESNGADRQARDLHRPTGEI